MYKRQIRKQYPDQLLAYNCSPSFNWKKNLDDATIAKFQRELGAMGYKFQFVTLAGFHSLNHGIFELARKYKAEGMKAYSDFQQNEFASEANGYTATRHQREVGTGYFDQVSEVITGGKGSTLALVGSTEKAQFLKNRRQGSPLTPRDHKLRRCRGESRFLMIAFAFVSVLALLAVPLLLIESEVRRTA